VRDDDGRGAHRREGAHDETKGQSAGVEGGGDEEGHAIHDHPLGELGPCKGGTPYKPPFGARKGVASRGGRGDVVVLSVVTAEPSPPNGRELVAGYGDD
jgi:hypothetical protein